MKMRCSKKTLNGYLYPSCEMAEMIMRPFNFQFEKWATKSLSDTTFQHN